MKNMNLNEWVMNQAAGLLNEEFTPVEKPVFAPIAPFNRAGQHIGPGGMLDGKIRKPEEYSWMSDEDWNKKSADEQQMLVRKVDFNDPDWYSKQYTKGNIHTAFCDAFEKEKKENPVPLTWCRDLYSKGFDTFQFGCEDGRYGFDVYGVPKNDQFYGKANIRVFVNDSKIEDPHHRTVSCFYVKKDTLPNEVKSIFKITNRLFNDGVEKFNKDNGCVIRKNESLFQLPIPNPVNGKLING